MLGAALVLVCLKQRRDVTQQSAVGEVSVACHWLRSQELRVCPLRAQFGKHAPNMDTGHKVHVGQRVSKRALLPQNLAQWSGRGDWYRKAGGSGRRRRHRRNGRRQTV
ncbi:hypothetical protein E2C01_025056 [Portunus trituberculatus]|uniref:Uncharacterized protein n=1 Tax=Portunus trituberculatus TaxID=210409 RepID=A0A5B7EEN9_PORTR|nr:hypothetical protein [Portunus trituberculatus]